MKGKFTTKIVIASIVIFIIWLLIIWNGNISQRIKNFVTAIVTISPIPPIP